MGTYLTETRLGPFGWAPYSTFGPVFPPTLAAVTQYIFAALLALGLPPDAGATGDSLYFLLPRDTVVLRNDAASGLLLFDHYLAARQTLYGAARFYGHTLDEVYRLNPTLRKGYTAGTRVTVAIPPTAIRSSFSPDSVAWFVPVRYRMAPRGNPLRSYASHAESG